MQQITFSKSGSIPCLCASSPTYNEFLRFTSSTTPVDLFSASMVAEGFFEPHSCTHTCIDGTELRIQRTVCGRGSTEACQLGKKPTRYFHTISPTHRTVFLVVAGG